MTKTFSKIWLLATFVWFGIFGSVIYSTGQEPGTLPVPATAAKVDD
jgi:hypothetical protein